MRPCCSIMPAGVNSPNMNQMLMRIWGFVCLHCRQILKSTLLIIRQTTLGHKSRGEAYWPYIPTHIVYSSFASMYVLIINVRPPLQEALMKFSQDEFITLKPVNNTEDACSCHKLLWSGHGRWQSAKCHFFGLFTSFITTLQIFPISNRNMQLLKKVTFNGTRSIMAGK